MKYILLLLMLTLSCNINAQSYTREGNTFTVESSRGSKTSYIETEYKIKEKDGKEYTIYVSKSTGSCFIYKVSKKSGKEYKKYLGPKISQEICKELGIEYKGKKS